MSERLDARPEGGGNNCRSEPLLVERFGALSEAPGESVVYQSRFQDLLQGGKYVHRPRADNRCIISAKQGHKR